MNEFFETWGQGLGTLALGALGGAIALRFLARQGAAGEDLEMQLNDIDEQVEHMVAQLRDLDQQHDKIDEDFYAEQKNHYEGKAAALLRQRDEVSATLEGARHLQIPQSPKGSRKATGGELTPAVGFFEKRPQLKGVLWGAGTVLVIGGLFLSVSNEQSVRAPGGSMTGNTQPGQAGSGPPQVANPEIQALLNRLDADPEDLEALNLLTRQLLLGNMLEQAAVLNERALEVSAEDVQARTYAAVLLSAQGEQEQAAQRLDALSGENPKHPDPWFFRGMLAMRAGDQEGMRKAWGKFVEVAPDSPRKERIRKMLEAPLPGARPEQPNTSP